jgi:glycosyltransferase involved in cell wall biosynthesis
MEMIGSGMAPQCVSVVPLGCQLPDPSSPKIDRAQAKAKLGLAPDAILLTIFGFVTAYKGHLPAVQALKKLPKQYHLAIVGGPHPENSIDRTLNSVLEVWEGEDPARLIVTGYVPRETVDLYHAAGDICLAPFLAVNPTGSASITWALTSGKPTIASNIPAFAEIQAETDCLLLCMPGAVHELAWQIQRLAADQPLQHRLAQNAMRFCEQNSWACVVERLLAVYQEMNGFSYRQAGAAQQASRHAA